MSENKKVLLLCLSFIVIYNILFFRTPLGLGFGVILLLVNSYFFLIREKTNTNLPLASLSSFLSIIFAFFFAFRGNEIVRLIDINVSLFSALLSLYLYRMEEPFTSKLPNFFLIPILVITNSIQKFFEFFNKPKDYSAVNTARSSLFRGIVISIPIFIVLLFLLVRADPVFGRLTSNFFSSVGERSIVSLIIFVILFALGLTKLKNANFEEKVEAGELSGKSHELAVVLGTVSVLFTAFIVIQFKYLFSGVGERELADVGIKSLTFSEYVNRGFFELLIAASVAGSVILYTLRFVHKLKGLEKPLIQILSTVVTVETMLILFSDAKRLIMYADAHGLTRARVFGFVFLIWLLLFLIILIFKAIEEVKNSWFLNGVLAISLLAVLFINIVSIDELIADKYKPTVNGEVDYYYLTSLSADASSSWEPALVEMNSQIIALEQKSSLSVEDSRKIYWAKNTLSQINRKVAFLKNKYGNSPKWQSFNYGEYSAYRLISAGNYFNTLPDLLQRINALDLRIDYRVRQNTPIDRSTNPPLSQ